MGNTTRFSGGLSIGGGSSGVTTASPLCVLAASFDPTSASQVLLGTLPKGARVIDVLSWGGATGGTNPTVDVGTASNDDGFANELDADANSSGFAAGTLGTDVNMALAVETPVYGKVGGSAATGGTTTVHIHFIVEDI